MRFLPELMTMNDGAPVKNGADMARRRGELLSLLETHAYGVMPAAVPVRGEVIRETGRCCAGDARLLELKLTCRFETGEWSFPLRLFLPNEAGKRPLLLFLNFSEEPYCEYCPVEEIVDNGFALAYLYYEDVTSDDGDFENGAARFFPRTDGGTDVGKIGIWAWSLSRALDHLLTMERIDGGNVGVIGHSRLGKTALWCAANDERVRFVCSNDSGCMGAALHRGRNPGGETLADITRVFPYWFCGNLRKYAGTPDALPFDQHMLLACAAPRAVLVNSAALDAWADPPSEQLACAGASPAWEVCGAAGYLGGAEPYGENEGCLQGNVGYYKRSGVHFLGRKDWLRFMAFIREKM